MLKSSPNRSSIVALEVPSSHSPSDPIPFFITGTEERVITRFISLPTMPFSLGQPISVAGGQMPDFEAVVYRSPGGSAADNVGLDLTTLPLYTGPAEVGGLLQMPPSPSRQHWYC